MKSMSSLHRELLYLHVLHVFLYMGPMHMNFGKKEMTRYNMWNPEKPRSFLELTWFESRRLKAYIQNDLINSDVKFETMVTLLISLDHYHKFILTLMKDSEVLRFVQKLDIRQLISLESISGRYHQSLKLLHTYSH